MIATIYIPSSSDKRIKFKVPYEAIEWRAKVKALETSLFDYEQKVWSVTKTNDNLETLKAIFGKNFKFIDRRTLHQETSERIVLEKVMHKGQCIILLKFHQRRDWLNKVRTLTNVNFSRTKGFWYLPYSKESYNEFLKSNLPFEISSTHGEDKPSTELSGSDHDNPGIDPSIAITSTSISTDEQKKYVDIQVNNISFTWNSNKFIIRLPYTKAHVDFVKKLEGSWWNQKKQRWICKDSLSNLEKIQKEWMLFNKSNYESLYILIGSTKNPFKIILYYSPNYKNRFCIKLIGHGANHQFIKSISSREYVKELKIYTLPYEKKVVENLISYYKDIGYRIDNRLTEYRSKSTRPASYSDKIQRFLEKFDADRYSTIHKMAYAMSRQHYGVKTIKDYCGKIVRLMQYHNVHSLDQLTKEQINTFIDHLQKSGCSFSLINQIYSAVKYYFREVDPGGSIDIDLIKRPRRSKTLPRFMSSNEIERILSQISNIKHLVIVYLLYGSGLRKSELLNLKLSEVYWERNQLLIINGKGHKDRMVNLSQSTKELLEIYFHEYKPQTYLIEGMYPGKKYSPTAISKIIHTAASKAKISRKITPHMLRHSFATHLMDQGTALPIIQELLGHKDIKTTLIYTHVTNKDMSKVISPLDNLKKK